jgi:hypothetical protein
MASFGINQPSGKNRLPARLKLKLELAEVLMNPSQNPPLNDQFRERDIAPLVPNDWPTAEETWSDEHARDLDAVSDRRVGKRPLGPSIRSGRSSDFARNRPSIGRRMLRTLARFFITVLIGVGATLAWQSYGDEAKETVTTWAPSLGWLLSAPTTKSPAAAETPRELVQQLEPIARDLAAVRGSVEQLVAKQEELAAKQEQMGQNIATLQAVEQGIRQKTISPPPPPSRAVPGQPSKPPQPPTAQSAPPGIGSPGFIRP